MKRISVICFALIFLCLNAHAGRDQSVVGHTASGTEYGFQGSKAYAQVRHGPDGALFLDPYFIPFLESLNGKVLLDAGCGAAPWAIYAARNGATVYGIDIQANMIERGNQAILEAKLEKQVFLNIGDVANLPYSSQQFDGAISINVGCNLPSSSLVEIASIKTQVGLGPHIQEIARTLKPKGKAIFTAPASFDVIFHNGTRSNEELQKDIDETLQRINENNTADHIKSQLERLTDIYRATFVNRNNKIELVTAESSLKKGEAIWRKVPGLVVPNHYHSEQEYVDEFKLAGLTLVAIYRPKFNHKKEQVLFNEKADSKKCLGMEYINHHPFVIFVVEK